MGHVPSKVSEFNRRTLSKESTETDRVVEMLTFIDGRQFTFQRSNKVLAMLFLSNPDDEGFELEIVEKGIAPHTEFTHPGDESSLLHPWQSDAFASLTGPMFRRSYPVEGDALNQAKRIDVHIRIDGRTWLAMSAREPGVMGLVVTPKGFDIHVVGANDGSFKGDRSGPDTEKHMVLPWQVDAIGLQR